jgi:queuosine precursor transporter
MRYLSVISYIAFIILVNVCYAYLPAIHFGVNEISAGDFLVGLIYLIRDFAQRQIGHWVILAMIAGTLISFWLADPVIANASVAAFAVGELVDWLVFTFTGKPLSQRLLLSASLSAPVDTYIFLQLAHHFNWLEFGVMTVVKCIGVYCLWQYWQIRQRLPANSIATVQ